VGTWNREQGTKFGAKSSERFVDFFGEKQKTWPIVLLYGCG
jgi:hypothetical protein